MQMPPPPHLLPIVGFLQRYTCLSNWKELYRIGKYDAMIVFLCQPWKRFTRFPCWWPEGDFCFLERDESIGVKFFVFSDFLLHDKNMQQQQLLSLSSPLTLLQNMLQISAIYVGFWLLILMHTNKRKGCTRDTHREKERERARPAEEMC